MDNRELFNLLALTLNDVNAAHTAKTGRWQSGVEDVVTFDAETGRGVAQVTVYEGWTRPGYVYTVRFRVTFDAHGRATLRFRGYTRRVPGLDNTRLN